MDLDDILLVVLMRMESKSDHFERIINVSRYADPKTMDISDEGIHILAFYSVRLDIFM